MLSDKPTTDDRPAPTQAPADLDPRVLMAAERTLLAWIRTGIAMMGFGFVVARFGLFLRELMAAGNHASTQPLRVSPFVGTGLLAVGAIAIAVATLEHIRFLRAYARGETLRPTVLSPATMLAALLVVAGIALAVYLVLV